MAQIIEITPDNFDAVILQGSQQGYVVVDFWAPWCNPCKQLKPLLERLATEYNYTLATINTEQFQQLATEHGVRGIPDVRIYHLGVVVDQFSGALAEKALRLRLQQYMPSQVQQTLHLLEQNSQCLPPAELLVSYQQLLQAYPDDSQVILKTAQYQMMHGDQPSATALLQQIRLGDDDYAAAQSVLALSDLQQACSQRSQQQGVARTYADGACAAIAGDYESALDAFLAVVKQDRNFKEQAGRKAMLVIFDLLEPESPLIRLYQRQLARYIL